MDKTRCEDMPGAQQVTIVAVDMDGYTSAAKILEESVSVELVAGLNYQIQNLFVNAGLSEANVQRDEAVMATTGDGAILVFARPEDAIRFARGLHEAAASHNATKTVALAERHFRIGVATGEVYFSREGRKRMGAG